MSTSELRQCRHCELWFPEESGYFRPFASRGRTYLKRTCRACERAATRQWVADFPARAAATEQHYRAKHPDRLVARAQTYRLAHLDAIHAREAQYRNVYRERIRERQRLQKRRARAALRGPTAAVDDD